MAVEGSEQSKISDAPSAKLGSENLSKSAQPDQAFNDIYQSLEGLKRLPEQFMRNGDIRLLDGGNERRNTAEKSSPQPERTERHGANPELHGAKPEARRRETARTADGPTYQSEIRLGDRALQKDGAKIGISTINGRDVTTSVSRPDGSLTIYGRHDSKGNPGSIEEYKPGAHTPFRTATRGENDVWTTRQGDKQFQKQGKLTVIDGEHRFQTNKGTFIRPPDGQPRFEPAQAKNHARSGNFHRSPEGIKKYGPEPGVVETARKTADVADERPQGDGIQSRRKEDGSSIADRVALRQKGSSPERDRFLADNGILPPDGGARTKPETHPADRPTKHPLGDRIKENANGSMIGFTEVNGKEVTAGVYRPDGSVTLYGNHDENGNPRSIREYKPGAKINQPFRTSSRGENNVWTTRQAGKELQMQGHLTVENGTHKFQTADGTSFVRTPDGKVSLEVSPKPDRVQEKDGSKIEYRNVNGKDVTSAVTYPNGFKAVYSGHDTNGNPTSIKEYAKDAGQPFRTAKLNGDTWKIESSGKQPIELKGTLTVKDGEQTFDTAAARYKRTAGGSERIELK